MAGFVTDTFNTKSVVIEPEMLDIIAELDEFKGAWRALSTLAPERLSALRRVATIESIGSSTRIEGSKLSDQDVEKMLSNVEIRSFETRDEQEVAGYARVMETIFASWSVLPLTENHVRQLHRDLLRYSTKDERHGGEYKKVDNDVEAFDANGKSAGVVFQTASPFDTPRLTKVEREKKILGQLPELSLRIYELSKERGQVKVEDIIRATGAARGTVKDHLNHLIRDGYLVQHGKGKGTWYSLP